MRTKKILVKRSQISKSMESVNFATSRNARLIEKKHQQIVDGACRVFFEKGYNPTSIRMIAHACGMSTGQLYHYISSKDDALYLVHKHVLKVWDDYLKRPGGKKESQDPLRELSEALHRTLEFMVENRKLMRFVYTESKYLGKEYFRLVREMENNYVIGFWKHLLKKVNKGKWSKSDLNYFASLVAFIVVFLPLRGWTVRDRSKKKNVDSLISFILGGLSAVQ